MDRRSFLTCLVAAPILTKIPITKAPGVFAKCDPFKPKRNVLQQLHYWHACKDPDSVLCIREDAFKAAWDSIPREWRYGHTLVAKAGYDHMVFQGSPLTWFPDKEWFTYHKMHEDFFNRTGKHLFVIDEGI